MGGWGGQGAKKASEKGLSALSPSARAPGAWGEGREGSGRHQGACLGRGSCHPEMCSPQQPQGKWGRLCLWKSSASQSQAALAIPPVALCTPRQRLGRSHTAVGTGLP